MATLKGKP